MPSKVLAPGGFSRRPWLTADALPSWSQQNTVLPDGAFDPGRFNDCGETCVAMVVAACRGVAVSPGAVRAAIGGPGAAALTDAVDLVSMLRFYNVSADALYVGSAGLEAHLRALAVQGLGSIVLGLWPVPGGALHWMLTRGAASVWSYVNPWTGERSWWDWPNTRGAYRGQVVVIHDHYLWDMASRPMPY